MKGSILIGIMLASVLLMLSFGVALAAKENMTMSANESMTVNITPDNMPLSVIMIPQDNMTAVLDNKTRTMLDNKSISDNMTMPMSMPMKMPMNMSMPMNMPMSMPMKTTDAPMNIVVLQNVTVNIITIMPLNISNA
ncbi:MAG: hypothetical protein ACYDHX_12755 [Methanothrix sp.]